MASRTTLLNHVSCQGCVSHTFDTGVMGQNWSGCGCSQILCPAAPFSERNPKSQWLNSWEKSCQVVIQTNSLWCFTGGELGVWEYVGWAWEVQAEGCDQGERTGKGGWYGEALSRTWVGS